MKVNLVTVCGHNTIMLRHMLNHYKDFVDEIYVVVYLSSDKDRVLSEVNEITRDLNIDIHKTTIEERKTGAMWMLTALVEVSIDACNAMPWLLQG